MKLLLLATLVAQTLAQDCVNGERYADQSVPHCQCIDCFTGPLCQTLDPTCPLNIETNQAFVMEEFWRNKKLRQPTIEINSVYRTAYQPYEVWYPGQPAYGIGEDLREQIYRLHDRVGNVHSRNYSIVMAHGGTQLFQAAFYALSLRNGGRPQKCWASTPYYYLLPYFVRMNPSISFWDPVVEDPSEDFIELMVAPNNPTGRNPPQRFPHRTAIHDAVFKWPAYTTETQRLPVQPEVTIFSLSKLTGHSGSRLGWAFVADPQVARDMGRYVYVTTHGVTIEAQFRALTMLRELNRDGGEIFEYTHNVLKSRWDRLLSIFANKPQFRIDGERDFCLAWVECVEVPTRCPELFLAVGIRARSGVEFGGPANVRLNMMVHDVTFNLVAERLQRLVSTPASVLLASSRFPKWQAPNASWPFERYD